MFGISIDYHCTDRVEIEREFSCFSLHHLDDIEVRSLAAALSYCRETCKAAVRRRPKALQKEAIKLFRTSYVEMQKAMSARADDEWAVDEVAFTFHHDRAARAARSDRIRARKEAKKANSKKT